MKEIKILNCVYLGNFEVTSSKLHNENKMVELSKFAIKIDCFWKNF